MGRNEEGGIHTQKLNTIMVAILLVLTAGLAMIVAESADGETHNITSDTNVVKVEGSETFTIFFEEDTEETIGIEFKAKLVNNNGETVSSGVSPSSGSLDNGEKKDLEVEAPKGAGQYTLEVEYTVTIGEGDDAKESKYTDKKLINVVEPVKLKAKIKVDGNVDLKDQEVYFKVDGKAIVGSEQLITVEAGKTKEITYDWVTMAPSAGGHKVQVAYMDGGEEKIIGEESSFYGPSSSYTFLTGLMGVFFVILLIVAYYVYRKPVKNFGKPKARR